MTNVLRFFACIVIALMPIMLVGTLEEIGLHQTRSNAGWALICSILLLGFIAYLVLVKGWRSKP